MPLMYGGFGLIVIGIIILVGLVVPLCIGGTLIANGTRRRHRVQTWIGWIIVVVPSAFLFYNAIGYRFMPLRVQAERIMSLPQEANVISVQNYTEETGVHVVFRLPDSKPSDQWMQIVWSLNHLGTFNVNGNSWESTDDELHRTLTYDPATKQFEYADLSD